MDLPLLTFEKVELDVRKIVSRLGLETVECEHLLRDLAGLKHGSRIDLVADSQFYADIVFRGFLSGVCVRIGESRIDLPWSDITEFWPIGRRANLRDSVSVLASGVTPGDRVHVGTDGPGNVIDNAVFEGVYSIAVTVDGIDRRFFWNDFEKLSLLSEM